MRSDWFDQNFDEGVFRDAVMAGEHDVDGLAGQQHETSYAVVDGARDERRIDRSAAP